MRPPCHLTSWPSAARAAAMAWTSSPGSSSPVSMRERPLASADRTSSRLATLFDAGTRARAPTSAWRIGAIGRGSTGCEDIADDVHTGGAHRAGLVRGAGPRVRGRCRWVPLRARRLRWRRRRDVVADGDAELEASGRDLRTGHLLHAGGALPEG